MKFLKITISGFSIKIAEVNCLRGKRSNNQKHTLLALFGTNDAAQPESRHDKLLKKYINLIMTFKDKTDRPMIIRKSLQFDTRLRPGAILRIKLRAIFLN